jgi:hypothetical protein
MSGLATYPASNRTVSAQVGYSILQAGVAGFLTDAQVQAATSADDLIADVNGAVVAPGAEAPAQRLNIARALVEGKALGDLSDSRVAAATGVVDLATTYTWVSVDPAASNGHLGPDFYS